VCVVRVCVRERKERIANMQVNYIFFVVVCVCECVCVCVYEGRIAAMQAETDLTHGSVCV